MQHRKLHLKGKVVNHFDVELREVNLPNEVKGIGKDFILIFFYSHKENRQGKGSKVVMELRGKVTWLMLLTTFCQVSVQMIMGIDAE